ncbi:histone-fold-containing protein [Cucurbitaria berberidis CBS 394.84]|uniref:Histone-fold-containing protein n=1 Tax=Cucurbitaria berberidis CBS 394.84 TaxID=1168544 RepID=A0A9P4L362_9PLEO|nr:histone-fold-containing protein [Cucurbitaria berberidis CBS 394.84]KAF1839947.1 histone-fold-containing protein [Cucurbitaria berberidis CBS 394.84]
MSSTPPKREGVEPAQSPDEEHPMDRNAEETQTQGLGYEFEVKEQDRWLPIANVSDMSSSSPQSSTSPPQSSLSKNPNNNASSDANIRNFAPVARIMKMALPENAKIAKEAKECMQECVSEFISFITSEASEKCQQEKRKTVNGEDILFAMTSLGFENYSEALKIYLSRYRENLLANQNKPPSGQFGAAGASGPNAGAENQHVLSGDSEMAEDSGTAFGYTVHNGNGSADY